MTNPYHAIMITVVLYRIQKCMKNKRILYYGATLELQICSGGLDLQYCNKTGIFHKWNNISKDLCKIINKEMLLSRKR